MKKLILIPLILLGLFVSAQSYQPKSGNWNYTGYNKFASTRLTVGNTLLTESKIISYDNTVADNADTTAFDSFDFEAVRVLNSLGVTAKILPLSLELGGGVLTPAMGDGNIYYNLCLVKETKILTSFTFIMSTAFDGTGDNYNGIGIYSISAIDGSLTKLSETANNPNIWKATAGIPTTVNLPTPLTLQPGKYIIACIYNNSAQTTAPSMQGVGATTWYNYVIPNGVKLSGYSATNTNNTLPATVTQNFIYPTSSSYVVIGK